MLKSLVAIYLLVIICSISKAQNIINGRILSKQNKEPLHGATIKQKSQTNVVLSKADGTFSISIKPTDTLMISYVGHVSQQIVPSINNNLEVLLEFVNTQLEEVVVSTGYQTLPKERTTGSFVQVDNKLINRSVSTNIIDRLRDVVPGLSFNRVGSSQLSIRGQSTIYGNAEPLIVIDNFPFEGNLQDINPNDVENITILRDAAAASIWGAKAGNGVIVITTKRGRPNQPINISFNANVNIGEIPDIYAKNILSSPDYIEIEKRLFANGFYNAIESSGYQALSPVVDFLYKRKADPTSSGTIDSQIEAFKNFDIRDDIKRYLYQNSINQQYSLNLTGGGTQHSYFLSTGFDKNQENLVKNSYERISINAGNTFSLLDNRLTLSTGINYIYNNSVRNNKGLGPIAPYLRLVDESGTPLAINQYYRSSFIANAQNNGLLDWSYSPLLEIENADNSNKRTNIRLNTNLKYQLYKGLSASVLYQYTNINEQERNFQSQDTYFVRDLINRFTQVNGATKIYPVPLGGILDNMDGTTTSQNFRSQLNFQQRVGKKGELNAIGGFEVSEAKTANKVFRYYGYDIEHAQNGIVNYVDNTFPLYYDNSRKSSIPNIDATRSLLDRYRSFYANASYVYDDRFTVSGSARLDQSNLFGVNTNQKGVPLWSAGLGWVLNNEEFYNFKLLPYLKLRATYGYNGSVNKSVTAFTTASLKGLNLYQQPYATITNPPNSNLRWERVKIVNFGIDFSTHLKRVSGSVEFYYKEGLDLIGDKPFPPSSGITLFRGNTANTAGKGVDISLSSKNLIGTFNWQTDLNLGHLNEKVTNYEVTSATTGTYGYIQGQFYMPKVGRSLYSIYGYNSAGLDPQSGDPLGYLNGEVSKNYVSIIANTTADNMVYGGSLRPTTFGSVRNSLNYRQFSFSFNISYQFGYHFRKQTVNYSNDYGLTSNNGDYALRWQKPGDETRTIVPSIPNQTNANRDAFYRYSDVLIDKADNIRLQDLRLGYIYNNALPSILPFKQAEVFIYAANLGLLWKATKFDVDPDYQTGSLPTTLALGLKINLNK